MIDRSVFESLEVLDNSRTDIKNVLEEKGITLENRPKVSELAEIIEEIEVKPKPVYLCTGSTFNSKFNSISRNADKIVFTYDKPNGEFEFTDFSLNQDNSILGWLEDGIIYVSGLGNDIYAHYDCSTMFGKSSTMGSSIAFTGTSIEFNNFNTSNVGVAVSMFGFCSNLAKIDCSSFDTSNFSLVYNMFEGCSSAIEINTSNFVTDKFTNMASMFQNCTALKSVDVSNFNTNSVSVMTNLFNGCTALTEVTIANFTFDKVNSLVVNGMFTNCTALKELKIIDMDFSKVSNVGGFITNCPNLETIIITKLKSDRLSSLGGLISSCPNLKTLVINNVDLPNLMSLSGAIASSYPTDLEIVVMQNWRLASIPNINDGFFGVLNPEILILKDWTAEKLTTLKQTFASSSRLKRIVFDNVNFNSLSSMDTAFAMCSSLKELRLSKNSFNIDPEKLTVISSILISCDSLEFVDLTAFGSLPNATTAASAFAGDYNLRTIIADTWTSAGIKSSQGVFSGDFKLKGAINCTNNQDMTGEMCNNSTGYFSAP